MNSYPSLQLENTKNIVITDNSTLYSLQIKIATERFEKRLKIT